jgi:riboflavin kinase/FMN adenylyltransferase
MKPVVLDWKAPAALPPLVLPDLPVNLAIGVFDGVHRGHQELIKRVVTPDSPGFPLVVTFAPSPAEVLHHREHQGMISTVEQRINWLGQAGVKMVIRIHFSQSFARIPGPIFLEYLASAIPGIRQVVVGFNFALGRDRDVTPEILSQWMGERGIRVDIVPALKDNELSISSSRVRRAIASGDLLAAKRMLGRPFSLAFAEELPTTRQQCYQILPPAGTYRCTYIWEDHSREGMMAIAESGDIHWEPRITGKIRVIPRRIADVSDSTTKV